MNERTKVEKRRGTFYNVYVSYARLGVWPMS